MKVNVKLFARARDIAGTETVALELPDGGCVKDLRETIAAQIPELRSLVDHLHIAIGTEYAADGTVIAPGDELACFPPVSGG